MATSCTWSLPIPTCRRGNHESGSRCIATPYTCRQRCVVHLMCVSAAAHVLQQPSGSSAQVHITALPDFPTTVSDGVVHGAIKFLGRDQKTRSAIHARTSFLVELKNQMQSAAEMVWWTPEDFGRGVAFTKSVVAGSLVPSVSLGHSRASCPVALEKAFEATAGDGANGFA